VTYFHAYVNQLIKGSRNYILPLNKTHNEIKPDEDKTMNLNNNAIVQPQQEAPNVQSFSTSEVINSNKWCVWGLKYLD
jgi:hypothetical protein